MLVRDIMTSPAVTIHPADTVVEAARVLERRSLTSLPVVDGDCRLLGIISESDVIGRLPAPGECADGLRRRADATLVSDVMTHRVVTAAADDDLAGVIALMSGTALKSVPVILNGRVAGMVSRRDIVRAMVHADLDARSTDELSRA